MNKLVNANKGNLRSCWRLFNKQPICATNQIGNTSSTYQQIFNPFLFSQKYMQFLQAKSLSKNIPSYHFSMKHSQHEGSSQYDEQELAANISDSILRESQYNSTTNRDSTSYTSVNSSVSNSSNQVQKDSKKQQQDLLSKMQASQQQTCQNEQNLFQKVSNQEGETSQVRNLQGKENSQLNTSVSIEQQQLFQSQQSQQQQQSQDPSQNQSSERGGQQTAQKQFKFNDFCELTKFRLSVTNTLVALPTYLYLAESVSSQLIPLGIATQLMAMSSQTTNQIMEQDFDKQMTRTQRRPLPYGLISTKQASLLALSLYLASNAIFLSYFPLNTALVANAIFFGYIAIYTPMKRMTTFNTTIGAIVGALTPYIGYTAAGGAITDLYPLYYSLYMIFWQFQHFYGISWIYKNDYKKAGYKMCDEKNEALFYMLSSFSINAAANYALFFTNPVYPYLSVAYSVAMAATYVLSFALPTYKFYQNPNVQNAKLLKNSSYIHLSVFFLIIIIDMCLRIYEKKCKVGLDNTADPQPHKKLDEQSLIGRVHKILFEKKQASNQNNLTTQQQNTPQQSSVQIQPSN